MEEGGRREGGRREGGREEGGRREGGRREGGRGMEEGGRREGGRDGGSERGREGERERGKEGVNGSIIIYLSTFFGSINLLIYLSVCLSQAEMFAQAAARFRNQAAAFSNMGGGGRGRGGGGGKPLPPPRPSDEDISETNQRNKAISSSAITRAMADAQSGIYNYNVMMDFDLVYTVDALIMRL